MSISKFGKAALEYARLGYYVLPLVPKDKAPLTELVPHAYLDATRDEKRINEWWHECPNANVGIACRQSGVVAVDVDNHNGINGREKFRSLPGFDQPPRTPIATTGGGGLHILFKHPGVDLVGKVCEGVDLKDNGYIAVHPSIHPSGAVYQWKDGMSPFEVDAAEMPKWLQAQTSKKVCESPRSEKFVNAKDETLIRDALRYIPPDDYQVWLHVGMAMKTAGFAVEDWQDWSSTSHKYAPEDCLKKWASFKRLGIGIGTVFFYAKQHGFSMPWQYYELDDIGNAARFVTEFGGLCRWYSDGGYWLTWDGRRWKRDDQQAVLNYAKATARSILREASECSNDGERTQRIKWAKTTASAPKLKAMLDLAKPDLSVSSDMLDQDPFKLNCVNGTIDLRSGKRLPHSPADYITKIANCNYEPNAVAPRFMQFLSEIFDGCEQLIEFVQRALGYSLTGSVAEQKLFICYGTGANGKSTLFNVVRDILGDYASETDPALLIQKRNAGGATEDVARLRGIRLATTIELNEGTRLDEARTKQLSGGDRLSARFLYGHTFEFAPSHKLFVVSNFKPQISAQSSAMWRRIRLIPFNVQVSDRKKDHNLGDKLKAEYEGVLTWLVQGCIAWCNSGLPEPPQVMAATDAYKQEQDNLSEFIATQCRTAKNAFVPAGQLQARYSQWCKANGELELPPRAFRSRLMEKGFQPDRTNKFNIWRGLSLIPAAELDFAPESGGVE